MITGNTNPSLSARSSQFQSSKVGCPIRKSTDQRLFAPSRSLSQRTTSFIASYRQGIHQMPLGHLIALISNAHRDRSADRCLGETQLLQMTIRLGAHCTERPEVIQDKPNPDLRLRADLKILHANRHKQLTLLEYADVYVSAQEYPLFTMSIARALRRRANHSEPSSKRKGLLSFAWIWWSRTGSNRRPEACKATALPTELRPRSNRRIQLRKHHPRTQHNGCGGPGKI